MDLDFDNLQRYIDINGAAAAYNLDDIKEICKVADKFSCRSVTVNPCYINACFKLLPGRADIIKATQIGAPLGTDMTSVKIYASKQSEIMGAQIIQVAMNIGAFMSENIKYAKHELETTASNLETIFSVIIESALMDVEQTAQAVDLAASVTPFVKLGSGFYNDSDLLKKAERAYELSKGCVQLTVYCENVTLSDLSDLKNAGAEYFSLNSRTAEKLFAEAGIEEVKKTDIPI